MSRRRGRGRERRSGKGNGRRREREGCRRREREREIIQADVMRDRVNEEIRVHPNHAPTPSLET